MIFYKSVLTSGLQVAELQPSFVPGLEGLANEIGATRLHLHNLQFCAAKIFHPFHPFVAAEMFALL